MLIVFRVDSSSIMGAGHLMRCRNLAQEMKLFFADLTGLRIVFLCRPFLGNCAHLVQDFELIMMGLGSVEQKRDKFETWMGEHRLQDQEECMRLLDHQKIDLLVVDHYGANFKWENWMKYCCHKIVAIDDYDNRYHRTNFVINHAIPSEHFVPNQMYLCGPKYALINRVFFQKRQLFERDQLIRRQMKKIQISFGGSDLNDETGQVFQALTQHSDFNSWKIDLIYGFSADLQKIPYLLSSIYQNVNVYAGISQEKMADLLVETDLCIGGGGVSLYERSCLGCPSLVITIADNQLMNTLQMEKLGAVDFLEKSGQWTQDSLFHSLKIIEQNLEQMSAKCLEILPENSYVHIFETIFG